MYMRPGPLFLGILLLSTPALSAQKADGAHAVWIGDARYWIEGADTARYRRPGEAETLDLLSGWLRDDGVIDTIAAQAHSQVRLGGLRFQFRPCGVANAFYMPRRDLVLLCAEMLHDFEKLLRQDGDSASIRTAEDALRFFAAHEVGHAVMARYHLPVTGDEEVAADEFAAWMLDQVGDRVALLSAHMVFMSQTDREDMSFQAALDPHGLSVQRERRLYCWTLTEGEPSSPILDPTSECRPTVQRARRAWSTMLAPYRPKTVVDR